MAEEIITVSSGSLMDWLLARRLVPSGWSDLLRGLTTKMAETGAPPRDYSTAVAHLASLLSGPEGEKRNFLGQYSSPAVKEWRRIVSAFENSGLHLAENARDLSRLVAFDFPAARASLAALRKQVGDARRRVEELAKAEAGHGRALETLRSSLVGEEGADVQSMIAMTAQVRVDRRRAEVDKALHSREMALAVDVYSAVCEHLGGDASAVETLRECAMSPLGTLTLNPSPPPTTVDDGDETPDGIDWGAIDLSCIECEDKGPSMDEAVVIQAIEEVHAFLLHWDSDHWQLLAPSAAPLPPHDTFPLRTALAATLALLTGAEALTDRQYADPSSFQNMSAAKRLESLAFLASPARRTTALAALSSLENHVEEAETHMADLRAKERSIADILQSQISKVLNAQRGKGNPISLLITSSLF